MTNREKNLMKVIEQIANLGYDNSQFSVVTTEVEADLMYGATNTTETLPPHIGVWVEEEDRNIWANTGLWDRSLYTANGDTIAIYFFSNEN